MQKKLLFLLVGTFFIIPLISFAAEDMIPTLDYIRNTEDGIYKLYGKNIPSDPVLVNIYADDKKIDRSNITLTKDGADIKNYYRSAGAFVIERLKVEYGSGDIAKYLTDKKTESLKIRKNSAFGFSGQFLRETKNGYDVITLAFINPTIPDSPLTQSGMQIDRKLIINGQEKPLVPYTSEYKDGIYYFTPGGVTFIEKNLTEQLNTVGLKLDGLSSNYISIKKGGIVLDAPSRVEIEDVGSTKNLKVLFSAPKNLSNMNGKEVYVNGTKMNNDQVTLGLNQLIVRYDISKLPKNQDTLAIFLKDTITNQFSNEQIIHIGTYSNLLITAIDTGEGDSPSFTFVIHGNMNALFGDIYKFKININGVDYTRDGTKELVKNASGAIQKDSNGDNKYEVKNKIEFKKTGVGIEFDFSYSQLKDGENILFIKNDNTVRESNKVSFIKKNAASINYYYLTGAALEESKKKESLVFEIGKDFEKKLNPTSMLATDRNISLGKIKLSNLKDNEYYDVAFTLSTDLSINPFSHVTLGTTTLETATKGNTTSFIFKKQGFGKDLKIDAELLLIVNELYNVSSKAFSVTIGELTLKKFMGDGSYETLVGVKNPLKAQVFYSHTASKCFDGVKDFCSLIGENDPLLSIAYTTSTTPVVIDKEVPASKPTGVTRTGTGTVQAKKNITSIVVQSFENEKFKKIQDILTKKYDALKKKGSIYLPTFRKVTNSLLAALKNFELKTKISESIVQIKSSLKTINEVLKKAKKE